jgi:hypothetical protein
VGGRRPKRPGPSPTLGSLGPSHQWRHKSRVSLRGPPCAHGVAGTPHGEVRDTKSDHSPRRSSRNKKKVLATRRSGSGYGSGEDSSAETDEELAPSPNVRRVFTRLQERRLLTPGEGASAIR